MKRAVKQASKIFAVSILVASLTACGTLRGHDRKRIIKGVKVLKQLAV